MTEVILRKLARSYQWQSLYVRCKEIGSLNLFHNSDDLSEIQRRFLMWLEIYNSLYMDLRMEEDYISEEVIEDDIRCEAYLLYKSREKKSDKKKGKNKRQVNHEGSHSVIFTSGDK